ncbi:MAG TPA: protoporphyrinogen oxidase [Elusimicrobia bacterium]|nr:protoporphyrinogen oxidase [Elusimicrobiota bacterium]HBT61085.1 protoporphyrinogen oxidase [Elusimicrobiota bacterium]
MVKRGAGPAPYDAEVLILGGGLAGLSAAYHLQKGSRRAWLLAEKESRVGGTSGSVARKGFVFDRTGHLLHLHDSYGKSLVRRLLRANLTALKRSAWIRLQGCDTRYPFQANTFGLPFSTVVDCLAGFLGALRPGRREPLKRDPSFAGWCLRQFGPGICRHFLYPYNRKLFGVPLSRLTTDWQARFVPKPNPSEVLAGALMDQTKGFGYNAVFYYPRRGGAQALADALAARLPSGRIHTSARVAGINVRSRVARIEGLGEVRFKHLVNTLPLPEFIDLSGPWPQAMLAARQRLRHASVWCLNLGVDRADLSGRHWVYFSERRYPFYRVGYYSNFCPGNAPAGTMSLYVEVSRPGGARVDLRSLERETLAGLRECGILRTGDRFLVKEWNLIPYAYVIYDFERKPALAAIGRHLARQGVQSIGRYGAWKYSFMEEALLDGRDCARRLDRPR